MMKSLLAKFFWLLLAVAHAFFLGKISGRLDWGALSLGDAARVAGLVAAIVYFLVEAHGLGATRFLHPFGDRRRVVAFWSLVILIHAAVPFRAEVAEAPSAAQAATSIVFVLPLTAGALLLPLLRRDRPEAGDATLHSPPQDRSIAAISARFRVSRFLHRLLLPRERAFLERQIALAPPHSA